MTNESLTVQLKGLQTQVAVLEAQVEDGGAGSGHTLATLDGCLKGQTTSSEADIKAAEYALPDTKESAP